jgi:hypothetical protein
MNGPGKPATIPIAHGLTKYTHQKYTHYIPIIYITYIIIMMGYTMLYNVV